MFNLKDKKKALFILSFLSVFYLNGWKVGPITITPFVLLVIFTSIFSSPKKTVSQFLIQDLYLILFFLWGIISFFYFNISRETLEGIFGLGIYILFYFNVKNYLGEKKLRIFFIFSILFLLFLESLLSLWQFIAGRPLGLPIEEVLKNNPYGKMADDGSGFRATGTMKGPNSFSSFLTILLPFIFLLRQSSIKLFFLLLAAMAVLVSSTRFSWLTAVLAIIVLFFLEKPKITFYPRSTKNFFLKSLLVIFAFLLFIPYFLKKISLTNLAFLPFGPLDTRIKLCQEAINLIANYPLFGVGLNRFSEFAAKANVTGIFYLFPDLIVHNVPLLIAAEMGIPALAFFISFIFFAYRRYFISRKKIDRNDCRFKDIAALAGFIYLLEANMVTLFPAPHFALFLAFMAIISL